MRGFHEVLGEIPSAGPSLWGAEYVASGNDEGVPETVYLPAERVTSKDAQVTLELRALTDGTVAMLAFTSLESLVACCGDAQPWVAVRDYQVENLRLVSGAEIVMWDLALPYEERRTLFSEES